MAKKNLNRESFLPREATKASLPGALVPVGAMRMSRIAPVPKGRFIHSPSDNANRLICKTKSGVDETLDVGNMLLKMKVKLRRIGPDGQISLVEKL